jgi:signal transduction histidine kinase
VTLPLPITTGLFRIYQEALTNVVRHSNAKQVYAKLIVSENMIILQIADDGKGIATEPSGKTFGLIGMKERAYILNGDIEIQSKLGKGTTITVSIPHPFSK